MRIWEIKYHKYLALEFSNPAYFKVHHLLVLTYMLQTGNYSEAWFAQAVELLREFLKGSITADSFRKQFHSVEKKAGIVNYERSIAGKFDWYLDILSVRTESSEEYIEDVTKWAQDVLSVIDHT